MAQLSDCPVAGHPHEDMHWIHAAHSLSQLDTSEPHAPVLADAAQLMHEADEVVPIAKHRGAEVTLLLASLPPLPHASARDATTPKVAIPLMNRESIMVTALVGEGTP